MAMLSKFFSGKDRNDDSASTGPEGRKPAKDENLLRAGLLREVNKLLLRVGESEQLYTQLVSLTCKLTASTVGLLLLNNRAEWQILHAVDLPEETARLFLEIVREMDIEGLIGQEGIIKLDDLREHAGPGRTIAESNFLGASFGIPGLNESWGIIAVANRNEEQRYTKDQEWIISYMGVMAGTLIYHSRVLDVYQMSRHDAFLALLHSLEAKDPYVSSRRRIVSSLCMKVAQKMQIPEKQLEILRVASQIYDVGMISVPDRILLKDGALTREEFEQMQTHVPAVGKILSGITTIPPEVLDIIAAHHERYDGTGYPAGTRGDRIPLGARIIHVCQAYEALTANRPYRRGHEKEDALRKMADCSGTQFDPDVLDVFLEIV